MGSLDGKGAFIRGGPGLIGTAEGRLSGEEGAKVILVDRDEGPLSEAARRVGSAATAVVADVTRPDDVERAIGTALARHGGLDILLLNAGVEGAVKPIEEYPIETFDQV